MNAFRVHVWEKKPVCKDNDLKPSCWVRAVTYIFHGTSTSQVTTREKAQRTSDGYYGAAARGGSISGVRLSARGRWI